MEVIYFVFFGFSLGSFLLSILFFVKNRGDKVANRLIGVLLLLFSYYLVYSILYWTKQMHKVALMNNTYLLTLSLFGPIFYLYLRRILTQGKITVKNLIHFVPFVLLIVFYFDYFIEPFEKKGEIYKRYLVGSFGFFYQYIDIILVTILSIYSILSLRLLKSINKIDYDIRVWSKAIFIAFLGLCIFFVTYMTLAYLGILSPAQDYMITVMIFIFVGLIGYFAFMQPELFNGKSIEEIIPFVKYKRTGLKKELSLELKLKLMKLLDQDKIYLRNDLGLLDIAEMLKVSRNHASQVINEHFNLSFYDFINKYRIIEAEKMINEDLNLNLTEIAYTVGFNNRISFYKAFKKFTGLTPSQYSKSHKAC